MFNLLGTIISTTFKAGVFITVGAVGFTYLTKPTDASLGEQLSKDIPIGGQTAYKVSINNTSTIKDYVCVKIADVPLEENKYLGVAHHWIPFKYSKK